MAIRSEANGHPAQVNGGPRIPYSKVDVPVVRTFPQSSSKHLVAGNSSSGHLDKRQA